MKLESFDVVVAGAGAVGAACAWKAAEAGLRVFVVEPHGVACGSTGAAMGHIVVMDDNEPILQLTRLSCARWHALAERLPANVEWQQTGTIWLAETDDQMCQVQRKQQVLEAAGLRSEILTAAQLREAEPLLAPWLAGGLLVPDDAVVYPPAAAAWFLLQARQHYARVQFGKRIVEVQPNRVRLCDNQWIHAPVCVIASGWQAPQLLPRLPVLPRKGHLAITQRSTLQVQHQLVELGYHHSVQNPDGVSVAFNVQPRTTGQILIGSSRQHGVASPHVDWTVLRSMLARAATFIPVLRQSLLIRVWTGIRPATPDGLPLIGPSSKWDSVVFATGHEGLGITTCLGTAELIADYLLGRPPAMAWTPFLPDRFGC